MTTENFMNYARSFGYEIRYTSVGMAYIELNGIKLTETMDYYKISPMLAQIGMAIMMDTLRTEEF